MEDGRILDKKSSGTSSAGGYCCNLSNRSRGRTSPDVIQMGRIVSESSSFTGRLTVVSVDLDEGHDILLIAIAVGVCRRSEAQKLNFETNPATEPPWWNFLWHCETSCNLSILYIRCIPRSTRRQYRINCTLVIICCLDASPSNSHNWLPKYVIRFIDAYALYVVGWLHENARCRTCVVIIFFWLIRKVIRSIRK